jgi:triphosphoribosyl-dephospho-CoA synthase
MQSGALSRMPKHDKAKHISQCLQLAILLEVSTNKPGNVNFMVGFEGTRVEHFLASAVAAVPSLEEAANRGLAVANKKLSISEAGVGQIIKDCVSDIMAWQKGGNTLLGTMMLFAPIAVAAGMTPTKANFAFDIAKLRENLKLTVESTTAQDAVHLYEAVNIANPSGLNKTKDFDVNDPASKERLLKDNVTLYEVFKIAAPYDDVCSEWINGYKITFTEAYPYLMDQIDKRKDPNMAIVHCFLKILSEHPDTFISRKAGAGKALEVSLEAKNALKLGGLETFQGRKSINELDLKLRGSGNKLNPGTTADITAATLALCVLSGFRP